MDDNLEPLAPRTESTAWRPRPDDLLESHASVAASPEALRSIVARHHRWRVRTLTGVLALALVAGPAAGYAIGQSGGSGKSSVASSTSPSVAPTDASRNTGQSPGSAGGGAGTASVGVAPGYSSPQATATQFILRNTADGVRIRGYVNEFSSAGAGGAAPCVMGNPAATPVRPCQQPPVCRPSGGTVEAQVSNEQVAGAGMGSFVGTLQEQSSTRFLDVVEAQIIGANDPTPIGTVITRTGAGVTRVRLLLADGKSDEMAPVKGLAIVAHGVTPDRSAQVPTPFPKLPQTPNEPGTKPMPGSKAAPPVAGYPPVNRWVGAMFPKGSKVEALDAGGSVVATIDLPGSSPQPTLRICVGGGQSPVPPTLPNQKGQVQPLPAPSINPAGQTPTTSPAPGPAPLNGIDGRPGQAAGATASGGG